MALAPRASTSAALALLWLSSADGAARESGQAAAVEAGAWRTPPLLVGTCNTVWCSGFAKYELPYSVHFAATGHFRWWAPYRTGEATEVGEGMFLSAPISTEREDGSWEVHYFSANRYAPDDEANSTICTCEYVGGLGPGKPRVLADYIVANVPASHDRPMAEVCAPFHQACPMDNATALQVLGSPFIEIYGSCGPLAEPVPQWALAGLLVLLVALCKLCFVLRGLGKRLRDEVHSEGYSALGGEDGWTDPALYKARKPARQESVDSLASTMPPMSRATTIQFLPTEGGPEAC